MSKKPFFKLSRRDFLLTGTGTGLGYLWSRIFSSQKSSEDQSLQTNLQQTDLASEKSPRGPWKVLADDPAKLIANDVYDVLVIGSGYGSSTLAARLSAASPQSKIAVLERGKEWLPGDFPKDSTDLPKHVRSNINPHGIIDTNSHLQGDMDVVSANGLGGTSLINAAIAMKPRDEVFQRPDWPREIRDLAKTPDFERYYNTARSVLKSNVDQNSSKYKKVQVHYETMKAINAEPILAPLNVNNSVEPLIQNEAGAIQGQCVGCGDCCSGCNVGAKNTLQFNYLALAKRNGAKIFTQVEVIRIAQVEGDLYKIYCRNYHRPNNKGVFDFLKPAKKDNFIIYAKRVILGAGSRGSTEILQRSIVAGGLSISSKLGSRVSANGDVLAFCYNGNKSNRSFSQGPQNLKSLAPSMRVGQGIMVAGDYRNNPPEKADLDFLFLEGSVPSPLIPLVAKTFATTMGVNPKLSIEQRTRMARDIADPQFPTQEGALGHSTMFLGCGHDSSGGKYELQASGEAKVKWHAPRLERSIRNCKEQMQKAADVLGGIFIENPWEVFLGRQALVATHPLGGCPMGDSADKGVVNHLGQMFKQNGELHSHFHVVDGSIIPTSLAVPPSLTITALAERTAEYIIQGKA